MNVRNASRQTFVLNLLRDVDYGPAPEYQPSKTSHVVAAMTPDGTPGTMTREQVHPASVAWLPGETKTELPDAIREIEQFKRAVLDGALVVVENQPQPAKPPATT